jgi:hypothetical protein
VGIETARQVQQNATGRNNIFSRDPLAYAIAELMKAIQQSCCIEDDE